MTAQDQIVDRFAAFLKWLGVAVVLLALGSVVYGFYRSEMDLRQRAQIVREQLRAGRAQEAAADYPGAWNSYANAAMAADAAGIFAKLLGGLQRDRGVVRTAQQDLAMEWLRTAGVADVHSFAEVMEMLVSALASGAEQATGVRKADLLAHLGWAYFIKGRSGNSNVQPDVAYKQALQADPTNPYANVFWGHWILWNNGPLAAAAQKFAAALATGRARASVRHFELAALANSRSEANDAQWLRVVNQMHREAEPIEASTREDLYQRYSFALNDPSLLQRMLMAVSADDQGDLQKMLLDSTELNAERKAVVAKVMTRMFAVGQSKTASAAISHPGRANE